MIAGSLFSGCGGFDLGLERAGMTIAWQAEIGPKPVSVLRHHWPETPLVRDVRDISPHAAVLVGDEHDGATTRWQPADVDVLAGGFPCQDVSVAGARRGLAGSRSGLFHEVVRIAGLLSPRWILLENVPGLLSSNGGRDMGTVVGALVELGYGICWRVLDSQHFGVPQRRRRVFIVGCTGGDVGRAAAVLFEPDRLPWDSAKGREAREAVAGTLAARTRGGGGLGTDTEVDGGLVAATLTSGCNGRAGRRREDDENLVASPLTTRPYADQLSQESSLVTARCLTSRNERIDAETETLIPTAFNWQGGGTQTTLGYEEGTPAGTLHKSQTPAIAAGGVRRIMPIEAERLQGFPDDWTRHGDKGELADGPRYAMIGNAVTVNVAEWIGRRMVAME